MHLTSLLFSALLGLSTVGSAALTFDQMGAIKCEDKTPDNLVFDQRNGRDPITFKYSECNTHCVCTKGLPDRGEINCYVYGLDATQLAVLTGKCNQGVGAAGGSSAGAGCVCLNP